MYNESLNHFGTTPEPLRSVGDEVQAELDRYRGSLHSVGSSLAESPTSCANVPSEYGVIVGTLAGPFVYALFVLVCQHIFAPELMADEQYGLMLMGTLPYGLILGGYIGARLPQLLSDGLWKRSVAWLALLVGIVALGSLSVTSGVAHLYMPFYALPVVSLLWVEAMSYRKRK